MIEKAIFLSRLPPTRYARGSICFYSHTRGSGLRVSLRSLATPTQAVTSRLPCLGVGRQAEDGTTALLAVARWAHKFGGPYARGTFRCPLRGQFNQPARLISPCRLARFNPSDREDFTCAYKAQQLSKFQFVNRRPVICRTVY